MTFLSKTPRISILCTLVALIASCATRPPRTSSEIAVDKKIEFAVLRQLANDPNLYARHIEVDVYRRVVTLSGMVFEPGELFEATRVASLVPGVITVEDQIELEVPGRVGHH